MTMNIGADLTQTYTEADRGFALNTAPGEIFVNEGKVYKLLRYNVGAGNVAAVVGQVAYYFGADGYETDQMTSDLSDSPMDVGAGILMSAPLDQEYGWVQVCGRATLAGAVAGANAGDPLTPTGSAADGSLAVRGDLTHAKCATMMNPATNTIACEFIW